MDFTNGGKIEEPKEACSLLENVLLELAITGTSSTPWSILKKLLEDKIVQVRKYVNKRL
jgi:hypothetical protein